MPLPIGYDELPTENFRRVQVETIWTFVASQTGQHRVLPDGRCDIILRLRKDKNQAAYRTEVLITGPSTQFDIVPLTKGLTFIGVRLRPGFAWKILGISPTAIVNQVLSGESLFSQYPIFLDLGKPVESMDEAVFRLDQFIARRVTSEAEIPGAVRTFGLIDALHVGGGRLSEADLAIMYGIDARTVRRDIKTSTGLTPKVFSMIIQFHRAVRLIRDFNVSPIAAALEAGYADQAHMTRMFKRFGGFTPSRLPELALADLPI